MIRDIFVNEHPIGFTKEIYAAASFLGVVTFYIFVETRVSFEISVTATHLHRHSCDVTCN
jgi:uncharacterized membrane protein YeiH